jgi:hypothetical protein
MGGYFFVVLFSSTISKIKKNMMITALSILPPPFCEEQG